MTIQHLLLATGITQFNAMIVNVQGKDIQMKTTDDIAPFVVGYVLLYSIIVVTLYYFIILKKESLTTAFLLGCALYTISDFTVYTFFENARSYLTTYFIDIIILGGGGFALTTYLVRNHFALIKRTILLPFILYVGLVMYAMKSI